MCEGLTFLSVHLSYLILGWGLSTHTSNMAESDNSFTLFFFFFNNLETLFMPLCYPLPHANFQPYCCSLDAGGAAQMHFQCYQRQEGSAWRGYSGCVARLLKCHSSYSSSSLMLCTRPMSSRRKKLTVQIAVLGLNLAGLNCPKAALPKLLHSPFSSSAFVQPCAVLWHQPSFPWMGQQGPRTWMVC